MKIDMLKRMLRDKKYLDEAIRYYTGKNLLRKAPADNGEIKGHILKSERNLEFVKDNQKLGYYDWAITGCYYALYHISLALLILKGYKTKNHDATLVMLIKEYYSDGLTGDDIALLNKTFLNYHDLLFYIRAKGKREEASYSTRYSYGQETVENLRRETINYVNKAKEILG